MYPLSAEQIACALAVVDAGRFGATLTYEPRIGSTNDLARDLAARYAPEGTLIVANEQTAGRGRLGRKWIAPPDSALLMSVIFRPTLPPSHANRLVMACGLAIAGAVEQTTGLSVTVKWPNDLQLDGKKFAGILPESAIIGDQIAWVIVGMGVNVNQAFDPPDPLAETATSLRMVTGQSHDRAVLLAQIMAHLNIWNAHLSHPTLLDAWRARCATLGQYITVETAQGVLTGLAQDVDPTGALWVQDGAGARHLLSAGEVTLVKSPPGAPG